MTVFSAHGQFTVGDLLKVLSSLQLPSANEVDGTGAAIVEIVSSEIVSNDRPSIVGNSRL